MRLSAAILTHNEETPFQAAEEFGEPFGGTKRVPNELATGGTPVRRLSSSVRPVSKTPFPEKDTVFEYFAFSQPGHPELRNTSAAVLA